MRNDTDFDVPMFSVLGIVGVAINPSGGTLEGSDFKDRRARDFAAQPIIVGDVPILSQHRDKFAVCMEPIRQGKIGTVAVGGLFACKVNVTSRSHSFATVKDGDYTQLQSASCGPVRLLWKEADSVSSWEQGSDRWCVGVM
jgi:hypothetical protein